MNYSRILTTLLLCLFPALLSAQYPNLFGNLDTPANGASGISGAINVTGWALSVNTVSLVSIYRNPVPGDPPPDSYGLIYIQNASFVPGARPDVASFYPTYPNNNWGWGTQVLTNMLPDSNGDGGHGNGTYTLHAVEYANNQRYDFGQATIYVDNRDSPYPFGTIDTPGQGNYVSGTSYVNFGWVLAPEPYQIPINGSTITVFIDGQSVGSPTYNNYRSDIAGLFPNLFNSNGAVGYKYIDWTQWVSTSPYASHLHSISWSVTDNAGHTSGIGSRYIDVGPSQTLTNTSNSDVAPNFVAGDSYTVTVAAGPIRAYQPVTISTVLNGTGQQTNVNMGSTDANGNFTMSGTKTIVGNWQEQWFVGGAQAMPALYYYVIPAPAGYAAPGFASIPGSFTAPTPTVLCNNIAGTWNSADGYNNSVEWTLNQSGNSVSGMLSFEAYLNTTDCGMITYNNVTGSYGGSGTTFSLTASNPSPTTACGYSVASSFADTVSLSGSSCSAASGNFSSPLWPVGISTALPHGSSAAQQPRQRSGTDTWTAVTPKFNVQYAAYIPVDHIPGPFNCLFGNDIPAELLYAGDADRGTYRAAQSLLAIPDKAISNSFQANTGPTRNYGYGSPANGFTANLAGNLGIGGVWSGPDEDGVPSDCYLWNAAGQASTIDMLAYGVSYPTNTKAQVNFYGDASNPLEPSAAEIKWNMTVTIDDSTPSQPTAQVNYTHTCYPAHQVKVNGTVVYSYQPPKNDTGYLFKCLFNPTYSLTQVTGQSTPVIVPAH